MSAETDKIRLADVDSGIAQTFLEIRPLFAQTFPGSIVAVPPMGGYRVPTTQAALGAAGKSPADGKEKTSKHQALPARALDLAVVDRGVLIVDGADRRYRWLGEQFKARGYVWGGDFTHTKEPDWDHVEKAGPPPSLLEVARAFATWKAAGRIVSA